MSDLELTREERALLAAIAHDRHTVFSRLALTASIIGPCVAFAIYGWVKQDPVALLIAFAGLFGFLFWRTWSELSHLGTFKSVSKKVVEHVKEAAKA